SSVKELSHIPLEVSLASIQQYCQKLWLNHGKIHRQPNSTVASSAQAIDAPEALLYPSHPIGLKDRVDCLMPRRRDAVFATEGDDLAPDPLSFQPPAPLHVAPHVALHPAR